MACHLTPERLKAEITRYLENDRLPERRILPTPNIFGKMPDGQGTPQDFKELYDRAKKFDEWPGDSWAEPIGFRKNPFLRQAKNLTLASIILSDPDRQQEAYRKMIEAGYTEEGAKEVLAHYHGALNCSESPCEETTKLY